MNRLTHLRLLMMAAIFAAGVVLLSAGRPLAAESQAVGLTTRVEPAGSGSVTVSPAPPYTAGQHVTVTANASAGWVFDRWGLGSDAKWWNAGWDYRVEVTAAAGNYARQDKPAEIDLNFTQIWAAMGKTGTLDPNSLRVVEVDDDNDVIDAAVPFQFDQKASFNPSANAAGTLVWIMKGNTPAAATRRYHVYFDVTGKGFTAPAVTPQITLTEGVLDAGQAAYQIDTPVATLFYHPKGGGFSSLNDLDGNDWISYDNTVAGNGGTFRGIPNAVSPNNGGYFHPGTKTMTTTLLNQGPLKATFHVIENKAPGRPKWEGKFEVYPRYTNFTMLTAPYDYWILYEGTPGGALNLDSDLVVRNDGTQNTVRQSWEGDLVGEEWVYFVDPSVGRSLYFASHTDDTDIDSYAQQGNLMTKFGFGRRDAAYLLDKDLVPRTFTWGLMDVTAFNDARQVIYSAYKQMTVEVGKAESRTGSSLGSDNPLDFTISGEHILTAYFKPAQFTVTVAPSPADKGAVTRSPDKATYTYNEAVTLAAAPTAPGYYFAGWQGDVTGMTNPITVNVTKNLNVTATFALPYTVTTAASPAAGGAVEVTPSQATYVPGSQITVKAVPASGYFFTGWSGDLSGTNPTETIVVNKNLTFTANFALIEYFTLDVTVPGGGGTVSKSPNLPEYAGGSKVVLTAVPAPGRRFAGWGGDASGTANPLEITILGDTSITARFDDYEVIVLPVIIR